MGHSSFLRSPKKEEQQVPEATVTELSDSRTAFRCGAAGISDDFQGIFGVEEEEDWQKGGCYMLDVKFSRGFLDLEEFITADEEEVLENNSNDCDVQEKNIHGKLIKKETESSGFWDDDYDEKKLSLNLNLNYQEVLDAWSGRGSLWTYECSLSAANTRCDMGEVPVMEEERARREASVMRYKEKRHSRLFSKKIRYQVRKLNADKRPRLKGRFVKRGA